MPSSPFTTSLSTLILLALMGGGCASTSDSPVLVAIDVATLQGAESADIHSSSIARDAIGQTTVVVRGEATETPELGRTESTRLIETNGVVDSVIEKFAVAVPVGERYTIDGLVGQINGRPIYVEDFLKPIAAQLMRLEQDPDLTRAEVVAELEGMVSFRFRDVVDSELIIAEAEGQLNPAMQKGLFGWLANVQEETIAALGGTRATAEASLAEEFEMTLDEFLEHRRTTALRNSILEKRLAPRVIVSWRDIRQEYNRRKAEFNPLPVMELGRIRFHKTRDETSIATISARIAEGASFATLVSEFEIPDDGLWSEGRVVLPATGISGIKLAPAIKSRLEGLPIGAVSEPLEQAAFVSWFAVLKIVESEGASLYDPQVQIQIETKLHELRMWQERTRYIDSLRSRWISDDIDSMKKRLIRLAKARYLSG